MPKVPKPKKREISLHSRAARRGESTTSDHARNTTVNETDYKPWLHSAQDAGISKKKKIKQLSRQQKLRHARGIEKAERDNEKLDKKVADSKQRGKTVQARRIDWDDVNGKSAGTNAGPTKFEALRPEENDNQEKAQSPEEVQPLMEVEQAPPPPATNQKEVPEPSPENVDEVL